MITFLLTLIFILLIVLIMSIGVIFKNKELKGSCGGIAEACNCNAIQKKYAVLNTILLLK